MCMHKYQVSQSRGLHLKTSIQRYFKPVNGLPDSRRQHSQSIPSATTAEAKLTRATIDTTEDEQKPRTIYHPADQLKIAKYACDHWVAAIA